MKKYSKKDLEQIITEGKIELEVWGTVVVEAKNIPGDFIQPGRESRKIMDLDSEDIEYLYNKYKSL